MRVRVHKHGTTVVLGCGRVVEGTPQGSQHQRETAAELGYGDDDLQMVKDHDALHVRLCQWLRISESFSLREALGDPVDAAIAAAEEDAVLAVQRFMRLAAGRFPEN